MSEGKNVSVFPPLLRGVYASCIGQGTGLGGGGTGSVPSAISTPLSLNAQGAAWQLPFFDDRASTTWGKTATAANKTNVTRVPQTLSFDIFHLLEEIGEDGCCRHEHRSRPRAKGRREARRRELGLIFGWYPNQNANASYVSEWEIGKARDQGGAIQPRSPRPTPRTSMAQHSEGPFLWECVEGKGRRNVRCWPFAA